MIHHCPICNLAVDPEVQRGTGATLGYWCAEHGYWSAAEFDDDNALDAILSNEPMDDWLTARDEPLPFDEWEAGADA